MLSISGGSFPFGTGRPGVPPKTVSVDPFEISNVTVSLSRWEAVRDEANATLGYSIPLVGHSDLGNQPDHPVHGAAPQVQIAWLNAQSELAGATPCYMVSGVGPYRGGWVDPRDLAFVHSQTGFRFPSEFEWEWAVRAEGRGIGGSVNWRGLWPWTDNTSGATIADRCVWTNGQPRTFPVEAGTPNESGLHHGIGNVWETVNRRIADPRGGTDSDIASPFYIVIRGGSCWSLAEVAREYTREVVQISYPWQHLGLRVARG